MLTTKPYSTTKLINNLLQWDSLSIRMYYKLTMYISKHRLPKLVTEATRIILPWIILPHPYILVPRKTVCKISFLTLWVVSSLLVSPAVQNLNKMWSQLLILCDTSCVTRVLFIKLLPIPMSSRILPILSSSRSKRLHFNTGLIYLHLWFILI